MKDLRLGRIAALVPEFGVQDLPLGSTLMICIYRVEGICVIIVTDNYLCH